MCIYTQATLHGNLSGQELKTMVSTTELQKTKGTVSGHYAQLAEVSTLYPHTHFLIVAQ